jgi:cytochrome c biogenesis protein CcmG/thiol:disulfide interchange protein DsbE
VVPRILSGLVLIGALLACGCDRGSRPELIGKPAPDFTVSDAGRTVSLHDYKGKVVLLNFWATWCAPCIEELPSLIALQHRVGDKVTILAVATDEDHNAYDRFMRDHRVDLFSVDDASQKSNAKYNTWAYPETYVVDRDGIVRRKFIGPQEWTSPEIVEYLLKL